MRKLIALLALSLAVSGVAYADGCPSVVSASTPYACTQTVFNDSGSTLTSGDVVVYDASDTDLSTTGYPYVITSTTADDPWTAGVMQSGSCPNQSLCSIVTYGFAEHVLIDDATDAAPVGSTIGVSPTTAGNASSYASGADTCQLGHVLAMEAVDGQDNAPARVFVRVNCD